MGSPQFYPPRLNSLLTRLCHTLAPSVAYCFYRLRLQIEPDCLEKLVALGKERVVLLPNHPTLDDGMSLFLLSARWGELFHYLVAYESFRDIRKSFLPLVGAYSIRRGLSDRASLSQTLTLLQQPACRLVIFPEGGCSYQNDTVMPFRPGAVRLALRATDKLAKSGDDTPNLYLVPVALKYRYSESARRAIARTLRRLEKPLKIVPSQDHYQRLRGVAAAVLLRLEKEYDDNINCWFGTHRKSTADGSSQEDWNHRIASLRNCVLTQCEQKLQLACVPRMPLRERVYQIQARLEENLDRLEDEQVQWLEKATFRLLNFNAIYDGYVAESPTPERYLDTLIRLEREIFDCDRPLPKAPRQVAIRIGTPVNLKDHLESYRSQREETITLLTEKLHQQVQSHLESI